MTDYGLRLIARAICFLGVCILRASWMHVQAAPWEGHRALLERYEAESLRLEKQP